MPAELLENVREEMRAQVLVSWTPRARTKTFTGRIPTSVPHGILNKRPQLNFQAFENKDMDGAPSSVETDEVERDASSTLACRPHAE